MARGFTPEQLAEIDWNTIPQPENHPLKLVVGHKVIRDLETNKVIAEAAPGYRFYWAHDHVHMAPENWDHRAAEKELTAPVATQASQPLGALPANLFATLATVMATSKVG